MSKTNLADFNSWITETTQLLRENRWHEIDVAHLIEAIEDLGKSERRGIASQLARLLLHLLKWQYSTFHFHEVHLKLFNSLLEQGFGRIKRCNQA